MPGGRTKNLYLLTMWPNAKSRKVSFSLKLDIESESLDLREHAKSYLVPFSLNLHSNLDS